MNYDELLAPAAKSMRPSGIRKFFDLAAEMPHCISLGVGEPDFKTPWTIRDAGIRSLEQGRTRYTANAGIKELRAEICRYLARRMELNYQPSEVLVTVGGSEAIDLTIRALVKPGDEVIIPEPCFVCYEPITSLTGGVPVHIATKVEDDFRLRADQLRAAITPRTKLLILPYPNNPTGGVMDAVTAFTIDKGQKNTQLLIQPQYSPMPVEDQIAILYCGTQGLLKGVPLDKVHDFEKEFLRELHTSHQHDVLDILKTGTINDDIRKKLEETAKQLTMNN